MKLEFPSRDPSSASPFFDTVEGDGKTKFTFLSVGTPTYTFYCSDASVDRCNNSIDAYLVQLQDMRKQSIISGLDRLQILLESLPIRTQSHTEKIDALKAAKPLIKGELALLSTTSNTVGATVSTVKPTTYAFGLIAGALVGLLIALQLTLTDKRVRSLSQLSKRFEARALLGVVTPEPSSISTCSCRDCRTCSIAVNHFGGFGSCRSANLNTTFGRASSFHHVTYGRNYHFPNKHFRSFGKRIDLVAIWHDCVLHHVGFP